MAESESRLLYKGPCDACGSSDACATYDDGHTHCYACGARTYADGKQPEFPEATSDDLVQQIRFQDLTKIGISEKTCRFFGYGIGKVYFHETGDTRTAQIAQYVDNGKVVAQHCRSVDDDGEKIFNWVGRQKKAGLWGKHLWDNAGRKILVITEGEKDALSWAEACDCRWAVVSIPNGADHAAKAIKKDLEWCSEFDKVVLMFDSDEPGKKASLECVELFRPGQAAICELPLKDANDMLVAGRSRDLKWMPWNVDPWRPDEVTGGTELLERILERKVSGGHAVPYHFPLLEAMTLGCRGGEIVTICAGTGVGKSEIVRQLTYEMRMSHEETIGYIALEESDIDSGVDFMGLYMQKRLRLELDQHGDEEIRKVYDKVIGTDGREKMHFWNHFGSVESPRLLNRIRFMVQGLNCQTIVLDHISIVVSGRDSNDERKDLDKLMTNLRSLVEELQFRCVIVSHLRRLSEGSHEEGARVRLDHLRGSGGIAQISDIVIGAERNQQSETKSNQTQLRVLKNRFTGRLGKADLLVYDQETGVLSPVSEEAAAFTQHESEDDDEQDF